MTFHHSDHDPWPMGIGNYDVTIIIAPLQENMPSSRRVKQTGLEKQVLIQWIIFGTTS